MNEKILREIKTDIRKNFGKNRVFNFIPKGNFNCYMYAVFNTVPTEIFYSQEGENIFLKSLIDEEISYFGDIGQISGKFNYTKNSELINALKFDLETLGILLQESSLNEKVSKQYVKIAFYYDVKSLSKGEHGNFHFIREEENNCWKHKKGWTGDVEKLMLPVKKYYDTKLIGYFKLSLLNNMF